MSITIDKEFESLIPPLSDDEFRQLEENCVRDGIREPLVVWKQDDGNSILIDGHNRFKIIAKHMLHYTETWMQFKDRDEAKLWIIDNQLGKRNLQLYDRGVLELKKKEILSSKAKDISKQNLKQFASDSQKSDARGRVDEQIGKRIGASRDTVRKIEVIQNTGDDLLIESVRSGDVSINKAYQAITGTEPKSPAKQKQEYIDEVKQTHEDFKEKKAEAVVNFSDIQTDKHNAKIIARELESRCLSMGNGIKRVYDDLKDGRIDLHEMAENLSADSLVVLKTSLNVTMQQLQRIYTEVDI